MAPLPRANAKRHIKAFKRDGWRLVRTTGSHYILAKDGLDYHLSIPYHAGQIIKIGLLKGLIRDAGLSNDEYMDLFYRKKRR